MTPIPAPNRPPSAYLAWVLSLVLAMLIVDLSMSDNLAEIYRENRSIEAMSAFLLLLAAALWFGLGAFRHDPRQWHIPLILLLMTLRELDFDKAFTTSGVLQLRLYSGAAPLWEKLIGAGFVILILCCGLRLAVLNLRRWFRGLGAGDTTSWLVGTAALLLIVSKSLDGIDRKLAPLGVSFSRDFVVHAGRLEELMEMVMAIMLVQAVVYHGQLLARQAASRAVQNDQHKANARRTTRSTASLASRVPDSTAATGSHAASSASSPATGSPSR